MDRKQKVKHLLSSLEQVIQLLEQGNADANLSVLKACYAEAQLLCESGQEVTAEALQELSTRVRSAIRPGMMDQEADVAKIALGFNVLSRVA
ncbi:MAG: hypothetical protein MI867_07125 [Pseudomonadales bacterium]|nr:hypothetical protein [Pseudomonadales bacterium]